MKRGPLVGVDGERILEHRYSGHILALLRGKNPVRHWRKPNIHIKPDLMDRVTDDHWSAARLRHIADKQSRPVIKAARVVGETLKKVKQSRVTPIAIT